MAKDFMSAYLKGRKAVSNLDTEKITMVYVTTLIANWKNFYTVDDVADLMASIEAHGVMQPIICTEDYKVISGHRRLTACRQLYATTADDKYKTVPCIIRHVEDEIEEEMMLIEANSTARILTSYELMEQARKYDKLLVDAAKQGYTYEGRRRDIVAKMMKVSPSKVGRYSAIHKSLLPIWMPLFESGEISESVAYEISKLKVSQQNKFWTQNRDRVSDITLDTVRRFVKQQTQEELPVSAEWRKNAEEAEEKGSVYQGLRPSGRTVVTADADAFVCPHCDLHVSQAWQAVYNADGILVCEQSLKFKFCPNCGKKVDGED